VGRLKLWLLDADVIIDLLGLNIFDKLVKIHEVHVASTVVGEVRFYRRDGEKVSIDFHKVYVGTGRVKEALASAEELREVVKVLPEIKREGLHPGELESIAILLREEGLTFCSCDAATIRALPLFDLAERGVSTEALLRKSGLLKPGLLERHTEEYFRNNLRIGQEERILIQRW